MGQKSTGDTLAQSDTLARSEVLAWCDKLARCDTLVRCDTLKQSVNFARLHFSTEFILHFFSMPK